MTLTLTGDLVEQVVAAWTAWENTPGAEWTAHKKEDVLKAAGLGGLVAHRTITGYRRRGYSIPDAIQALINDTAGGDSDSLVQG